MNYGVFRLIDKLRENKIHFEMASYREGYIMIIVSIPGERWEIEYSIDGEAEVEIFRSDGNIYGEEKIDELFFIDE